MKQLSCIIYIFVTEMVPGYINKTQLLQISDSKFGRTNKIIKYYEKK